MQFSARQDIEAPIEFVFRQVTDFASFERQALRRGAEVRRTDSLPRPGVGTGWDVTFQFRGRDRAMRAEVTEFDPPNGMVLAGASQGIDLVSTVELLALSRARTRLTVTLDLTPQSLTARIVLQSLRLARGRLDSGYAARIETFARDVEGRFARSGGV